VIEECALFRGSTEGVRRELATGTRTREVARGEILFREHDPVREFGVVARGRVKICRGAPGASITLVQLIGPAEACDWPGVLTDEVHAATAVAAEPCRLLVWERPRLVDLFDSHPRLYRNALGILARRQRDLAEGLREFTTLRVPQRLARALLRLSGPEDRWPEEGGPREIPLSRNDLAQLVGTTLFTVSRVLAEWESQDLVETWRGGVRVEQAEALAAIGRLPGA
jgi:CRP-like cAMP-binding protein